MLLSLGELTQLEPITRVLNHNSAAINLVREGPRASFRTRFILRRAHFINDLIGANLMTIDHVPSQENPAYTLTKGLTAAVHSKAKVMLCLEEMDQ
eukprot:12893043-Prorocentrum_lima.AAC.1